MTNDFLLAEQAGLIGPSSRVGESHAAVQRFAELIRDDERKACVRLCIDIANNDPDLSVRFAAQAIRARGNP